MIHTMSDKIKRLISGILCCLIFFLTLSHVSAVNIYAKTDTKGSRIIVSIGDSYSSGEGIEEFYGQNESTTNKVHNQDWLAHRSEKSWSGRLTLDGVKGSMSENRNTNWYFVVELFLKL